MNYRGGMGEGGGGQDGVEWEGGWDNCNSIINKYILKKLMREPETNMGMILYVNCNRKEN